MEIFKEIIIPVIEVIFPMIIAFIGWIVVHNLNKKNMKEEKRLVLKSEAYKELKEKEINLTHSHIKFISFLDQAVSQFEIFKNNKKMKEINKEELMKIYEGEKFKKLMFKCRNDSIKYISNWERNRIIFKDLEKEKLALQLECQSLTDLSSKIFENYLSFFVNIKDKSQINIKKLNNDLKKLSEEFTNYVSCVYDVSYDLQNLVYGDLFDVKIEKRKELNERNVTIDSLIKKHNKKIENHIN